jgi:predicted flap endonuclease-1-like 5' DNA nuclease
MATKVTFLLAPEIASGATSGILLGDFNNWSYDNGISLEIQQDGSLAAITTLEPGRTYQYRYLLNDGRWVNDGNAQSYVPVHGLYVDNCVITVPDEVKEPDIESAMQREGMVIAGGETLVAEDLKDLKETGSSKSKKATKAASAKKDDLTKIEGINKKIVSLLAAEKITTFKTLAKASAKKLKAVVEAAGNKYKSVDTSIWISQAKLAADGKLGNGSIDGDANSFD